MAERPFENADVATAFAAYPASLRVKLMELRALVFEMALAEGVGHIEETLKWGQPSYLTSETKSGTTIRIDRDETSGGNYALYVNCRSNLVEEWRAHYPDLIFGGNRSIHFSAADPLPEEEVRHCIALALTYHRRKKRKAK